MSVASIPGLKVVRSNALTLHGGDGREFSSPLDVYSFGVLGFPDEENVWISPAPFGDDALHGNVFAPGFVNARTAVMCRQRAGKHKAAANSANTAIAKTRVKFSS